MDDFAVAALISFFATLLPYYQALPQALCKAVESMETAEGGARVKIVWAATAAAAAACWLVKSRRCASYSMLCLLAINTSAMLASKFCSVEIALSRFTLVLSILLGLCFVYKLRPKNNGTPHHHNNDCTYICPYCGSTNGVYVNPCGHCNHPRPTTSS